MSVRSGDAGMGMVSEFREAAVLVLATRAVCPAAFAERDLPTLEMAEEIIPFGIGRYAIFLARAQGAAARDEGSMSVDRLLWIDGLVAHSGVDVLVTQEHLSDVGWHPVEDGLGGEDSSQVVRDEVEPLAVGVEQVGVFEDLPDCAADRFDRDRRCFDAAVDPLKQ